MDSLNWKRILLRILSGLAALWLLYRIQYAAGGLLRVADEIAGRTYRTDSERSALLLLCCILLLLFAAALSGALVLGTLAGEERRVRLPALAVLLFLLYVYACLYGYPLLDNHVTTAWLMTGQYTATLIQSLLGALAGVFGKGFHWNDSAAWRAVSGILLACPFVLFSAFVGLRNTLPVMVGALLPVLCFLTGEYCLFPGAQMLLLGLAGCALSAAVLEFFSDPALLGSEAKAAKGKALLTVEVGRKKHIVLMVLCAVLWGFTIWSGRIRSFGAVMRLVFSNSVYSYQKNLYDLADMRIAQAMLLSYCLSLAVKAVLSKVEFSDSSRFSGVLNTLYMLLLNIWVMPVLSDLLGKAADHAKGVLPGDAIRDRALEYGSVASDFAGEMAREHFLLTVLFTLCLFAAAFALTVFLVRLPFVRLLVWFLVYFSACTFVYCLIGLYYRSPLDNLQLLMVCYALNYLLNRLLSSGKSIRTKIAQ